jgi:glycosyltransferase involved in cell wall biosynthesis
MKKVCFFGIYDPKHWRNRMLKGGFASLGYEVIECRVNPREIGGPKKYLELYRKYRELNTRFDYVVVGFPGYLAVIVARLVSRSPIIFDSYISYFDGIRDRRDYSLLHPMMWVAWLVDFLGGQCSKIVLTINEAYREFFVQVLKVKSSKVHVLHKGADEAIFYPREGVQRENFSVGWWGSYIPLHGLPVIIEAAKILKHEDISFSLIGQGQLLPKIKEMVSDAALSNVVMTSYIPQSELVEAIANFNIVLGIFSPSAKAGRCVTNKVYEALCMGKAIITEDSPANREIFENGKNVYFVPPGDPQALARAIIELKSDSALREKLGRGARELFERRFTLEKIDKELADIIDAHA